MMIARQKDDHVKAEDCDRRHAGLTWTIGLLASLIAALIGTTSWAVWMGYDAAAEAARASLRAAEVSAELKAEAKGHAEFRERVLSRLEEIRADLKELRHRYGDGG